MNKFLPERSDINPRWFEMWGESFGAPDLASEMSTNDRLFARIRNRMFEAMGIDINAHLDERDVMVAHAYASDSARLSRLCGMVLHGQYFRTCISKSDFELISKYFSLEDLRIAVQLREFHMDGDNLGIDPEKLNHLAERAGEACINTWKASLDEQMGMRIHLMEDDEQSSDHASHTVGTELAQRVVEAVSQSLLEEDTPLAA